MGSDRDEKTFLISDGFIYCAKVTADAHAAITKIFTFERVIAKNGIKWVFDKNGKLFLESFFLGSLQLDIVLIKITMERNFHKTCS